MSVSACVSVLTLVSCCRLQVQYTALPHYEDKFEDFKADTVVLRRRFTPDGEGHISWLRADNGTQCTFLCGAASVRSLVQHT